MRRRTRHAIDPKGEDSTRTHDGDVQESQEGEERLLRDDQRGETQGSAQVSDDKTHIEVKTPEVTGVRVDHPRIVDFLRRCAKDNRPKDEAIKLSGMPYEVVDKYYQEQKRES